MITARGVKAGAFGILLGLGATGCWLERREVARITPQTDAARWHASSYFAPQTGVAIDLIDGRLDVALGPRRTGTTWVGLIVPLIPISWGFPPPATKLSMSLVVTATTTPLRIDLSGTNIRLPDGRVVRAECPEYARRTPDICPERLVEVPANTRRYFAVEFPVEQRVATSFVVEIAGMTRLDRPLSVPLLAAEWRRYWYYGFPPA